MKIITLICIVVCWQAGAAHAHDMGRVVLATGLYTQTDTLTLPGDINLDSLKLEMAKQKQALTEQFASTRVEAIIMKVSDSSYGYYIFADGQLLIEQKNIPGLPGNSGFITETEAQKTADLAIRKLKAGEMPPTISTEELKALQITAVYPETVTGINIKN